MHLPVPRTWLAGVPGANTAPAVRDLFDPNTGEHLQTYAFSADQQVDAVLDAAVAAHASGRWADADLAERAVVLSAFATRLEGVADTIAELDALNSGVPVRFTRMFAESLPGTVRRAVELAEEQSTRRWLEADGRRVQLRRRAWGPTALLLPWNAPAAVLVKNVAYALVAGAPVVAKPSPESPWSAEIVADALTAAGVPAGVFGLVHGDARVGALIAADPRIQAISMTGSTHSGRSVASAAGRNLTRLRLELGSNNPAVVLADADVPATARALASGFTKLNGQWCEAPRAVYADSGLTGELVDALVAEIEQLRLGPSTSGDTTFGPMAFAGRKSVLEDQVTAMAAPGARSVAPLALPSDGWFLSPTLIVGDEVRLPGEVFGPVLAISPVTGDRRAVARANALGGGLAGYVFTRDVERGLEVGSQIVAGEVKLNGTSLLDMARDSAQSFFGTSGLGGHGDRDVLEFFAGKQVLGADLPDPAI
ncbi:aldehyde dehydrogenase family protein [Cryptosporangium arvum]|uniref:NAD-dependent aldehyde dehydrogenase n=1 Tax=Cryptosporangium arvum DSM 44712 TaxID=927661 RepID=A0A010ZV50_9ACTN|nr:aldehyde dehydrogenase family protein [Cryptosporangium arvum]EXG82574.1 NAD-dependent aldehyde dehydrogenase [Cryptosporangium arvum DSM 44712]